MSTVPTNSYVPPMSAEDVNSDGSTPSETEAGFEEALNTFKEMTELATTRNLEMMIAQTDYGTMLSAAKMRVNPV